MGKKAKRKHDNVIIFLKVKIFKMNVQLKMI